MENQVGGLTLAPHPAAADETSAVTPGQEFTSELRGVYLRRNPAASPVSSSFSFPAGGRNTQSLASRFLFPSPRLHLGFTVPSGPPDRKRPPVVFSTLRSLNLIIKEDLLVNQARNQARNQACRYRRPGSSPALLHSVDAEAEPGPPAPRREARPGFGLSWRMWARSSAAHPRVCPPRLAASVDYAVKPAAAPLANAPLCDATSQRLCVRAPFQVPELKPSLTSAAQKA